MTDTEPLFPEPNVYRPAPGRVHLGLAADVAKVDPTGEVLSASGLALLYHLADALDNLDRFIHRPNARAGDRGQIATLAKQFDDTYRRVFAAEDAAGDPLADALDAFRKSQTGHAPGPVPTE